MWWLLAVGCHGKVAQETDQVGDTDTTPATVDTDTDLPMPADPRPITLHVHGFTELTLVFDAPTCGVTQGAPTFRAFWRNGEGEHVFVLVAEVIGLYTGPGSYDSSMGRVDAKLQEEAGGSGAYFATDTTDTTSITVDGQDDTRAWGEFTVSGMHGGDGAITLDPSTIPIWCPVLN
jgi:hypothetical protein